MKKIIFILAALVLLAAGCDVSSNASSEVSYPEPTGYVVDTANIIDAATKDKLTQELKSFDSTAQIAVVTVPSTLPLEIEEYSIHLAEKFKAGTKVEDNGIIFLVAYNDHKMRIEIGRGLEGKLTDAQAGRILDNTVRPLFKAGKYNEGILAGVDEIMKGTK